ncbi:MAG: DNA-methyltransferase [Thermoplasmatota archaeon]
MEGPLAFIRANRAAVERALAARDLAPRVHIGDACRRIGEPDASVALVVTSPPYPLIEMWDASFVEQTGVEVADPKFFEACHALLEGAWRESFRVLVPGGVLAVNVGDATRTMDGSFRCFPNHAEILRRCESLGFHALVPLLWKKPTNKPNAFLGSGFLPPNAYVTLDCEHILLFRKGAPRRLPAKDPLRYASAFSKRERDAWFSQIWELKGARQEDGLASFPEAIPERLVRMFSCLGETVVDPFAGSGTSLRVARAWGRRAVGVERNPRLAPGLLAAIGGGEPPRVADVLARIERAYAPRRTLRRRT